MRWFKRKERKAQCSHYKKFGEQWPENMIELVRFSPYKTDSIGYGISECTVCRKRAFSCMGLHMMSDRVSEIIDAFIGNKVDWIAFKAFLEKEMAWHKEAGISGKE